MNFRDIFFLFSFSILFLLLGCTQQTGNSDSAEQLALRECKQLCNNSALGNGADLSNGPCLGNPMQQNPDWACDIAHNPRAAVDDIAANQCSAFSGEAKHFVELDSQCNLIKIY
jgi:hypothetical protein